MLLSFFLAALGIFAPLRHQVVLLLQVCGGFLVVTLVIILALIIRVVLFLDIRFLLVVINILILNFGALLRRLSTALTLFGAQTY